MPGDTWKKLQILNLNVRLAEKFDIADFTDNQKSLMRNKILVALT
jgi:hypothetical protein